ncbi:MAG TPA: YceD family protein [Solimonas sp.]|nr:YceD family protein [Solimonas sp.]
MGIPARIRVSSAAAHQEHYEGELPLQSLSRLREVLADTDTRLRVRLQARQREGYATLVGELAGELALNCKRCGARYLWPLQAGIDWRLVADEATERALMQECEPLLVENDELALREAIEDEVLLALPMLPRCESCENAVAAQPEVAEPVEEEPRRENPFAALKKQLKSD